MNKDTMGKLIERGATIKCLVTKLITQEVASLRLGISIRQIRRLFKRYREGGAESLIHKNYGKPSPRKLPDETEIKVIEWLKEHGADFGPTFAQEKIAEYLNIHVSVSTIRTWQIRNGLFTVRRKKTKAHKRRARKLFFGIMLQLDGSIHDWFEGRGEICFLLTAIDDATGLTFARFAPQESTVDLMLLLWKYIEKHGIPHMAYTDHGGPYKVNVGNADGQKKTQLGRALYELGIELIHANSPQAKGRVERNHATQQDRLIKEMRLRNISTIEAANKYLEEEYLPQFNRRFTVQPARSHDVHRPANRFNLNKIFSIQEERVVQNDGIVHYEKELLQITKNRIYVKPKGKVLVRKHLDGTITLWIDSIQLGYEIVKNTPSRKNQDAAEIAKKDPVMRRPSKASERWNNGKFLPFRLRNEYTATEELRKKGE